MEGSSLSVLTWNVNGLVTTVRNINLKHGSLDTFMRELDVDICCFQEAKLPETKLTPELVNVPECESFWAFSREKLGYSGVTTYVRSVWSPVSAEADCLGGGESDLDREGRVLMTDHDGFVLLNVYVPNAGERPARARLGFKLRFLAALTELVARLHARGREVMVVGDMNVARERRDVHASIDFDACYAVEELAALAALLGEVQDVWRRCHPHKNDVYTVWDEKTSARAFNAGLRIDYVAATPGLAARVTSCEVLDLPPKWSDHAALRVTLRGTPQPPPHAPCALSSARMSRFNDRSQRSIAAMLARKHPRDVCKQAGAAAGGGGPPPAAQPKRVASLGNHAHAVQANPSAPEPRADANCPAGGGIGVPQATGCSAVAAAASSGALHLASGSAGGGAVGGAMGAPQHHGKGVASGTAGSKCEQLPRATGQGRPRDSLRGDLDQAQGTSGTTLARTADIHVSASAGVVPDASGHAPGLAAALCGCGPPPRQGRRVPAVHDVSDKTGEAGSIPPSGSRCTAAALPGAAVVAAGSSDASRGPTLGTSGTTTQAPVATDREDTEEPPAALAPVPAALAPEPAAVQCTCTEVEQVQAPVGGVSAHDAPGAARQAPATDTLVQGEQGQAGKEGGPLRPRVAARAQRGGGRTGRKGASGGPRDAGRADPRQLSMKTFFSSARQQ